MIAPRNREGWDCNNATVIGDVRLGARANIWFGAVLRGDNDPITVGEGSNIQDGSVLHTDDGVPHHWQQRDDRAHGNAHGCTIGDGSLIGISAVVLNRAVIGKTASSARIP